MNRVKFVAIGSLGIIFIFLLTLGQQEKVKRDEIMVEVSFICYEAVDLVLNASTFELEELSEEAYNDAYDLVQQFDPSIIAEYLGDALEADKDEIFKLLMEDKTKAIEKLDKAKKNRGSTITI